MSTEKQKQWREISEQLDRALDLEGAAREEWLAALERRDSRLAAAVRSLLAEEANLADFLMTENPVLELARADLAGQRLGAYTLEKVLGHGGMGTVWLAHRSDGRFEGRAAVKLLNAALLGRPTEQRFVQEGSVLAKLRHANIAHLIDAGVAPGGQPYLVLEYVDGDRIDAYVERHEIGLEGRIELFLSVLAAVAHAHSHLVIHRDLKPSNILVTRDGVVKLLDFGVAALLGQGESAFTREGGTALTPEYAAPEQLLGEPVTTATDVYALGLVLFVLLVGRHPHDPHEKSAPELARLTLEQDPPRPSDLAGDAGHERALRGDLDNIVAKALKRQPAERYGTVELLGQDLRRYLSHEPVSARPDTLAYRAAKFVRRHRGGVAIAAVTILAFIAAMVVISVELLEVRRQRDAALFQKRRAEFQARFAYQIMSEIGSDEKPITVKELMQKGVDVLERNYGSDPAFEIEALTNISGRYMDLGETENEYAVLLKAEKLARALGDPAQIASVQCNTVETELNAGRAQLAEIRMRDGLANLARVARPSPELQMNCRTAQARLLWGQGDKAGAVEVARREVASIEAAHLERNVQYNTLLSMLDILSGDLGHTREALQWNQRDTAALERDGRGATMSMGAVRHNRALDLFECGELRNAYDTEKRLVDEIVAREGPDAVPAPVEHRLGYMQVRVDESAAGLVWIERALRDARAHKSASVEINALIGRARAEVLLGMNARVPADLEQAEKLIGATQNKDSLARTNIALVRARLLFAQGRFAEAAAAIDRSLPQMDYPAQRTNIRLAEALTLRSQSEVALGRTRDALQTAREALTVAEEHALDGARSADVGAALMAMAQAQRALGDVGGARSSALRAVQSLTVGLGPGHSETRAAVEFR
ncbi:MAG TPA: serine/threonine-protein kinase [Steroidobacteraceae bacterium]